MKELEFKIYATGSRGTIGRWLPKQVVPLELDLLKPRETFFEFPVEGGSTLIHLAGIVGNQQVTRDFDKSYAINVEGARKIGMEALEKGVNRFLYISTSHVYQPGPEFLKETDGINPINDYAKQKFEAESVLQELFKSNPEKLCIIRVFSLLDWGMPEGSLGGVLSKLSREMSMVEIENGDDVRDFLTPKQVAQAIFEISKIESVNGTINLCSGVPRTVRQGLIEIVGQDNVINEFLTIKPGSSQVPRIVGCNCKLNSLVPNLNLAWNS
jgi:nucleoside-diphosphate-sugar epimerase